MSEFEIEFVGDADQPVAPGRTVKMRVHLTGPTAPDQRYQWQVMEDHRVVQWTPPLPQKTVYKFEAPEVEHGVFKIYCRRTDREEPLSYEDLQRPREDLAKRPLTVVVDKPAVHVHQDLAVGSALATTPADQTVSVSLQRTSLMASATDTLSLIIRNRTDAISFRRYQKYMDSVFAAGNVDPDTGKLRPANLPFRGRAAYDLLTIATDAFLMHEVGVIPPRGGGELDQTVAQHSIGKLQTNDAWRAAESARVGGKEILADILAMRESYYEMLEVENGPKVPVLPYLAIIRERLSDLPIKQTGDVNQQEFYGILKSRISGPVAMELIWSYWHEEGMLVQTLNTVIARFENRRTSETRPDPLGRFELDPIRPLNNLLWGWIQSEVSRTSVRRRAFEYAHEYGLRMIGKAIPPGDVVDERSKFLESFHNLLHLCHIFFKEDDDTTVIADGFTVLNALRETHLLLAEGAHNQFGDLPSTARSEMMIMQWLLARPEMREFLGGRIMVPYEEEWMDRVDTMKTLQGWTDTTVTHFRDLGVFGEQILLSVRYGNWSVINDPQEAANWARAWRPEIQRYVHAYRAATGVDLTEGVDATMPSTLLARRQPQGGNGRRRLEVA